MAALKGMRRDVLRRMIERNEMVLVESYHFDDGYGAERGEHAADPRAVRVWRYEVRENPVTGREEVASPPYDGKTVFIREGEFRGSGSCWEEADGRVVLVVHSNSNYTLMRRSDWEKKAGRPPAA
jgi:hypothetical protein